MTRARFLWSIATTCSSIVLPAAVAGVGAHLEVSGTLVTVIPTRDGFVIGADRRTYDAVRGDRDRTTKVTPIGRFTVAAETGFSTFAQNATHPDVVVYDGMTVAAEYLRSRANGEDIAVYLVPLGNLLINRLLRALGSDNPPREPDGSIYQLILAHVNPRSKTLSLTTIHIGYAETYGMAQPTPTAIIERASGLESGWPHLFGNTKAFNAIISADPRFDHWRRDKAIALLHRSPPGIRNVTAAEGVAYVRAITKATAEILPLIDISTDHVGSKVDVGLLAAQGGFRWLYRDQ